ncbi:MAG: hypothetical protein CMC51_02625 [Flavobacteriaceae bacterium]|nr:hypothetical protein [Flavobacteriaceae bacterium]MDA9026239.1 hypothetical protein [Flavobacteriaceae bacterium]
MKKLLFLFLFPMSILSQEIIYSVYSGPNISDVPLASNHNNIIKIYGWFDALGKNTLIFTARDGWGEFGEQNKDLRAYHYTGGGKLLWDIKDFADPKDEYGIQLDEVKLTDVDNNSVAEVSILYRLGGGNEVTAKLIMHEEGKKYAIRGKTGSNDKGKCIYDYDAYGRNSFKYAKPSLKQRALSFFNNQYNCFRD